MCTLTGQPHADLMEFCTKVPIEALGTLRPTAAAVTVQPHSVDSAENERPAFFTVKSAEEGKRLCWLTTAVARSASTARCDS